MGSIRRSELDGAVNAGILSAAQADRLVAFLAGKAAAVAPGGAEPRFSFVHVLYAMLALSLTHWFLERKQLEIPAGITATLAVVTVPLAIFAAQMALGYWSD